MCVCFKTAHHHLWAHQCISKNEILKCLYLKCKRKFDSDRNSLGFSLAAVFVVFLALLASVIWLLGGRGRE